MEKLKQILSEVSALEIRDICGEDTLVSLGIDSLLLVSLIVKIEDEWQITFPDFELNPEILTDVNSLMALITKYGETECGCF